MDERQAGPEEQALGTREVGTTLATLRSLAANLGRGPGGWTTEWGIEHVEWSMARAKRRAT